jgi:hypothetical protein
MCNYFGAKIEMYIESKYPEEPTCREIDFEVITNHTWVLVAFSLVTPQTMNTGPGYFGINITRTIK